jgi:hypothetical protein
MNTGSGYNVLFMRTDQLNLDTTVDCQAGDRLQIRLRVNRQTKTGAWDAEVYNNPDNARASFTPKVELARDGNWLVSRNLPDITGLELLKNIAYLYCGTWLVNSRRREIRLTRLSTTVFSKTSIDWSTRIDDSQSPSWVPRLNPYAQRNLLKWKDSDETKKGVDGLALPIPYGDGLIEIDVQTSDAEVSLFQMTFAASINSSNELPNYGTPLLIKTRTVSGKGETLTINKQAATPRLILVHPSQTIDVTVPRLSTDGETIENVDVKLKPCWFGTRPMSVVGQDTAFSLCFSPVAGNRSESCLIDRHYDGLAFVLRRMRVFSLSMRLLPGDVSMLDFSQPVRLRRVNVGGLVISDFVGYLNKVSNYGTDGKCTVTLVGF